jgi:hypothetical protein
MLLTIGNFVFALLRLKLSHVRLDFRDEFVDLVRAKRGSFPLEARSDLTSLLVIQIHDPAGSTNRIASAGDIDALRY